MTEIPTRRLLSLVLVGAALTVGAFAQPAAANARSCGSTGTHYITATHIRISGAWSCKEARALLRQYFRKVVREAQVEGGCAAARATDGCRVGRYWCYVYGVRRLTGSCEHISVNRLVRFRERDRGPDA